MSAAFADLLALLAAEALAAAPTTAEPPMAKAVAADILISYYYSI